ncbi:MAG: FAD-dependent oxidoreductase [Rhodovibrionaceae bacterium]
MPRDPRYDILFEPVRIGPVTARNRFYQVPHCNGMGHEHPTAIAVSRGVKAEGGWAVICTEECEIHPSSEVTHVEARLWDERDIPALRRSTDAIHEFGSLAGVELVHNAHTTANRYSREPLLAPSHMPYDGYDPVQARAMSLSDIRDFRRRHRQAALRAREAGFDIIYVYSGHNLALPMHFLSRRTNHRSDEYGGSLENRVRLIRELLEETKDAVGHDCAVAFRFAVDELLGENGIASDAEGREVVEMLAELPDLWDVNVSNWKNDSVTARFQDEGGQEEQVAFVKQVTSKPVVGVGRFTSPDAMVRQVKRGVLDMIGAARPSIADPWLPRKIEEGRLEAIRECIGCNICVSGDFTYSPIRCTQNPTMAEEWRKGWHPERIAPKTSDAKVLVVGAGPAGLEATRALAQRGYEVVLAEAREELGGRVTDEARLPGLSTYSRVRDYREQQLLVAPNVEIYRQCALSAAEILEFGFQHVALATGATWRRDGVGRQHAWAIPGAGELEVFTPDDIHAGRLPQGRVLIYDDDHYYLGGVLAELLREAGREVTLLTPAADVSTWTHNSMEQGRIQTRLIELGVEIEPLLELKRLAPGEATAACVYSGRERRIVFDSLLMLTARLPKEEIYLELASDEVRLKEAGIESLHLIGDAYAPGAIVHAVYSGHRYARELDAEPPGDAVPFRREIKALSDEAWPGVPR